MNFVSIYLIYTGIDIYNCDKVKEKKVPLFNYQEGKPHHMYKFMIFFTNCLVLYNPTIDNKHEIDVILDNVYLILWYVIRYLYSFIFNQ